MTQSGLSGFQIDTVQHQRGGVRPPQIVERESLETSSTNRRKPHPTASTLVAQRSALLANEDESVGVSTREAAPRECRDRWCCGSQT